jgi:hypothetical protein
MNTEIDAFLEGYTRNWSRPDSVPADSRLADVFRDCELDAIRAEFQSRVREPLIAYSKEKLDAALTR